VERVPQRILDTERDGDDIPPQVTKNQHSSNPGPIDNQAQLKLLPQGSPERLSNTNDVRWTHHATPFSPLVLFISGCVSVVARA
jgi:hypothetical protein